MARASGRDERHPPVGEGSLSIIAKGTSVKGNLTADGVVKVEGEVVGAIHAERQVLVSRDGRVEGDIYAPEVIIGGHVQGSIYADDRVELQTTGSVAGDISTRRVLVEEGSQLNGALRMADSAEAPKPSQSTKLPERSGHAHPEFAEP
jgi:cytoskeletal protein CcmA (bactofilin family)